MQCSYIRTFLKSRMNVNILRSDRNSERLLVVLIWDYIMAHINYPLNSMQRVGGEYQLSVFGARYKTS